MKILYTTISFFLLIILFSACADNSDNEKILTVISGKVSNLEVYPNTKEFIVEIIDFRGKNTVFSDSIAGDGTFRIAFDLYQTQDIEVKPIIGKIIASPGDSIHINIDFSDISNIQFSGDNQQTNTDLNKYLAGNYSEFKFKSRGNKEMNLSLHKSFCDSLKTIAEQKRQIFIQEFDPNRMIQDWTDDYINIKYKESLIEYPIYAAYKGGIVLSELDTPVDYYNFLKNIESDFSETMINTNIYELLDLYTGLFAQRIVNKDTTLSNDNHFQLLLNTILDQHNESLFKQMLVGNLFYQMLNQNDLGFYRDHESILSENIHDPAIKITLNNYYQELQYQHEHPEIKSNATLAKLKGTAAQSIIDSIWLQNKGKVIYIDFWATWCGPCKAEMPNSKKLQDKLAGEDIAFVYMCVDSHEEQWKSDLSEMQLDGQHYLCDVKQSSDIRKGFGINSIPYYMLVNKQGHIVEVGSYLRPMQPETIDKINTLLHEE